MAAERGRGAFDSFLVWNRRVHYYLGLYLLFFIWLFAFTGVLLNHPRWQYAQFCQIGFRARPNTARTPGQA
jgi:hypothetical protein